MTSLHGLAAAVAVGWVTLQPPPAPSCPETPLIITELGTREEVPATLSPTPGVVSEYPPVPQVGARYVRARVTVKDLPDCNWFLTVRDRDYRLIQTFGRDDFRDGAERWTRRVNGDRVLFDLQRCGPAAGRQTVNFPGYIWMSDQAKNTYYSRQGADPAYVDITTVPETSLRRLGDFAGLFIASFLRDVWSCTGVMITPDLFLTNWHCGGPGKIRSTGPGGGTTSYPSAGYWTTDIQAAIIIDLSWDGDSSSRELTATSVIAKDEALDYALLRIKPLDQLGPIRPVRLSQADPKRNDPIKVIHHPAGAFKKLSWNCEVASPDWGGWKNTTQLSEFTHVCDTEAGSSGAPVLNANNELIGLHHLGFDYDAVSCQQTRRENKAVKVSAILKHLQDNVRPIYNEIMKWQ